MNMKKINVPLEVVCHCRICDRNIPLVVDFNDYNFFITGTIKVQDAFPYLLPAERELFLTETCGECWDEMFKEFEDGSDY